MIETPVSDKRSWFLAASACVFVAVLAFSIYFSVKVSRTKKAVESLLSQKTSILNEMQQGGPGAAISSSINVKEQLEQIELNQFEWSKIIEKIENTIPKLKDSISAIVTFQSYTGNEDGKVSVSGTTRTDAFDSFADIALLIRAFTGDKTFKNVFVPSIAKSITPDGISILSFSMNFEYQKPSL